MRGKCDTGWFTYLLKFQDHCPELCYLRHLLVFVHCMNLESAAEDTHLFPDKATLMKHTPDSPVETYTGDASYLEGLDWLRKRVMENTPNPLDLYVGMHSLRVTFYFWAVLCKTPRPIMKENARHKSESMVAKYEGNALHIQKSLEQNPSLYAKQRLGQPQEDLLVTGVASQSIRVNGMSGSHNHISTLPDAAKLFVEKMLHVPSTDARYRNPSYLLDLSYSKTFTAKSPPGDQHCRSVVESLPLEYRNKVIEAYNLHTTQQHCQQTLASPLAMNSFTITVQAPSSPLLLQTTTGQSVGKLFVPLVLVPIISNSSSDPRRYEVPLKANKFGTMKSSKQALFLFQVVRDLITLGELALSSVPENTARSNEQAAHLYLKGKSYVPQKAPFTRVVDPFFECLHACCNGDIAMFQNKHPLYKASKFKQSCTDCTGLLETLWKN